MIDSSYDDIKDICIHCNSHNNDIELLALKTHNNRLEKELHELKNSQLTLNKENTELKIAVKKSISETEIGKELSVLMIEYDKAMKRVQSLKSEKAHLVDSMVDLIHEMEALEKQHQLDAKHIDRCTAKCNKLETQLKGDKLRVCNAIIETLREKFIVESVIQDVIMISSANSSSCYRNAPIVTTDTSIRRISHSSSIVYDTICDCNGDTGIDNTYVDDYNTNYSYHCSDDDTKYSDDGDGGDGDDANDTDDDADLALEFIHEDGSSKHDKNKQHKVSKSSPISHTNSSFRKHRVGVVDVIDRDDNDSIISSVSTHRNNSQSMKQYSEKNFTIEHCEPNTIVTKEALKRLEKHLNSEDCSDDTAKQDINASALQWLGNFLSF